jgi:ABC-2 type transport system permease protein
MGKIMNLLKTYNTIFFKKRWIIVLSMIFPIVFFVFFSLIFTNYDDVNRIPIGLIDEDLSPLSIEIFQKIHDNEALKVVETVKADAIKALNRNKIEAVFILKKDFQEKLQTSSYDKSVQLIYLDKSTIGPALGDIVASDLMTSLAIYKSANTANTYGLTYEFDNMYEKTLLLGEKFVNESRFEMSVQADVRTPSVHLNEDLDITKILRINITFGFTLIVFSLVILFMNTYFVDSDHRNSLKRLLIAGYRTHELYLAQFLSIMICGLLIVLTEIILIIIGLKIYDFTDILVILLTLLMQLAIISNVIVIATAFVKNKMKYQSVIAPLVFVLGLIGGAFWSLEYLSDTLKWFSYLSPFYWGLNLLNGVIIGVPHKFFNHNMLIYTLLLIGISCLSYPLYHHFIKAIHTAK